MRTMFADTATRLFGEHVTPGTLVAAEDGSVPAALWAAIEENGLTIAAASEAAGGVGARWSDAGPIVRASGRHAVPAPLAESVFANWLLGRVGLDAVAGPVTLGGKGTLADGVFGGTLADVPWGRNAGHVVASTQGANAMLVVLPCAAASVTEAMNTAREPRDTLVFEGVAPVAHAPLAGVGSDAILLGGAMVRTAQIAGALEHLLDTAIDYANQRVQFGRGIGKFQAIQHHLAVLAEQTSLASAAAEMAFASSEDAPSRHAIAAAKSVASEAAGEGAAIAHAVLGAIGFTYEHTLHFTTRRLWSWRGEFGGQTHWAQLLGTAMCAAGPDGYWPLLTETTAR